MVPGEYRSYGGAWRGCAGTPQAAGLHATALLIQASAALIFDFADGLHLCCSAMQTLLYLLSGLIVIRAENLIKPNNKADRWEFFHPPLLPNALC